MNPKLKRPGTKRLKLKCGMLFSIFAFKFNLRHFNLATAAAAARGEALPPGVLAAIESACEVCRPAAPPYSRGCSKIA